MVHIFRVPSADTQDTYYVHGKKLIIRMQMLYSMNKFFLNNKIQCITIIS